MSLKLARIRERLPPLFADTWSNVHQSALLNESLPEMHVGAVKGVGDVPVPAVENGPADLKGLRF